MTQDLLTEDATALAALIAKGEITPDEALDAALARMEAVNPQINAVVEVQEAVARDHIAKNLPDGPFRGVPFLLKDLGAEARDFPTNSGSRLFAGHRWSYDSEIFLRLKATGLSTFGRTASPELGVGPVTEAQVYGGPTRNPWHRGHTSGGSSGGAGAAVAAGIVPVAHGSDGGGSVRIPAASCGLVGFKPTRARLPDGPASGEGWAGMAIDGVLTRSLRDTAALIDACAGPDLGAPYWAPPMTQSHLSAMSVDPAPLRVRIGTTDFNGAPVHPDCARAVEHTGQLLADLGHHVDVFTPPADLDVDGMVRAWAEIVACGTALSVRTRLAGAPLDPDLVEPVTRAALRLADRMTGPDYLAAVEEIHDFGRRMARLFVGFDILVTPTLAEPPAPVGRHAPVMDDFLAYRTGPDGVYPYSPFCPAFNASGQPAISLPLAWSADDLPIGVHLAAPFGADEMLMSLSGQIERAAPWHAQQNRLIAAGGLWPRPA